MNLYPFYSLKHIIIDCIILLNKLLNFLKHFMNPFFLNFFFVIFDLYLYFCMLYFTCAFNKMCVPIKLCRFR